MKGTVQFCVYIWFTFLGLKTFACLFTNKAYTVHVWLVQLTVLALHFQFHHKYQTKSVKETTKHLGCLVQLLNGPKLTLWVSSEYQLWGHTGIPCPWNVDGRHSELILCSLNHILHGTLFLCGQKSVHNIIMAATESISLTLLYTFSHKFTLKQC